MKQGSRVVLRLCTVVAALAPLLGAPAQPTQLAERVPGRAAAGGSAPWSGATGLFHSFADEAALVDAMAEPPALAAPRAMPADLDLQAIVYVSPQNWVVWINGRAWRAGDANDSLRILKVTPQEVRLTVDHGDPSASLPVIVLRPMQTYLAATGEVSDRSSLRQNPPIFVTP